MPVPAAIYPPKNGCRNARTIFMNKSICKSIQKNYNTACYEYKQLFIICRYIGYRIVTDDYSLFFQCKEAIFLKISQSYVQLHANSEKIKEYSRSETLNKWTDQEKTNQAPSLPGSIRMALSSIGIQKAKEEWAEKMTMDQAAISSGTPVSGEEDSQLKLSDKDKAKIGLIEDFVYYLTGKRIKIVVPKQITKDDVASVQSAQANAIQKGEGPKRLGWGIDYQFHERSYEKESVSFSSSGKVQTSDGREISFEVNFSASREFLTETHISYKAGDAMTDPLTINFSDHIAELGERKIAFDLDLDGTKDQISFASPDSGFLALDKDGNGSIDDGSELFGPQSGNGFDELAVFDQDQNGWIDENDDIFDKLRVWSMDDEGSLQLVALGKSGVGAIYLGNVSTPYQLIGANGESNGQIARSGIYLKDNGTAGTIQHIDLRT